MIDTGKEIERLTAHFKQTGASNKDAVENARVAVALEKFFNERREEIEELRSTRHQPN
jgi:hypothetical protein